MRVDVSLYRCLLWLQCNEVQFDFIDMWKIYVEYWVCYVQKSFALIVWVCYFFACLSTVHRWISNLMGENEVHINAANNNATTKRNWLRVVRYFNNKRNFSFPLTRWHTVSYFNFYYYYPFYSLIQIFFFAHIFSIDFLSLSQYVFVLYRFCFVLFWFVIHFVCSLIYSVTFFLLSSSLPISFSMNSTFFALFQIIQNKIFLYPLEFMFAVKISCGGLNE